VIAGSYEPLSSHVSDSNSGKHRKPADPRGFETTELGFRDPIGLARIDSHVEIESIRIQGTGPDSSKNPGAGTAHLPPAL
jgi:hypothetical protein